MDYKRSRKLPKNRITGVFPSYKTSRGCKWESGLERDFFLLMEFDARVSGFFEQPQILKYLLDGKKRKYHPDVLVNRKGGDLLVEVKVSEKLEDPAEIHRFRAIRKQASREGYRFFIVTEKEIVRDACLRNLKIFHRYSRHQANDKNLQMIFKFFTFRKNPSFEEAINFLTNTGCENPIQEIYSLLWKKRLVTVISSPIGPSSPVSIPEKEDDVIAMSAFDSWYCF